MLIASAVALGASLILSAETLQLARHPESALGCDLNSAIDHEVDVEAVILIESGRHHCDLSLTVAIISRHSFT